MQPIVEVDGKKRFKENKIVRFLLDDGGIDMNQIARMSFDQDDREQFAQLIGYSLCGFAELGYVRNVTYEAAERMSESGVSELEARVQVLQEKLAAVREAFKVIVPELFQIHPNDLVE